MPKLAEITKKHAKAWKDIEKPSSIRPIETIYNGYRFRSRLEARWAVFFDALGVEYEYEPEGFELPNGGRYLPDFRVKCYGKRGVCSEPKALERWNLCDCCKYGCGNPYAYEQDCSNPDISWEFNNYFVSGIKTENGGSGGCVKCDHFKLDTGDPFDLYIEVKGFMTEDDAKRIKDFAETYPVLVVSNIPPKGHSSDNMRLGVYNGMNGTNVCPFNYETIDGDYFGAYPAAYNGCFYLWGDDSNYISNVDEVEAAYAKARQARFEHGETPKVSRV